MRASALFVLVLAVLGASAQASNATEAKTKTIKHTQPTCLAFRKLGNGFCRERYDAHGKPVGKGDFELYEHVATKSDCADLCYEQGTACTGYEYNAHKEKCEIHHDYVGAYKKADGNECVQAYMTSDWEKCHVKPPVDPAPKDEYELVGHGFCREEYDHWGYPYGSGEYKTECNAKKPCIEYECRQACSDYDWCKYYEFQDIDPMYMPEGAYPEDGQGRCELHKEYMGAYQASSKAVCYRKRQA